MFGAEVFVFYSFEVERGSSRYEYLFFFSIWRSCFWSVFGRVRAGLFWVFVFVFWVVRI